MNKMQSFLKDRFDDFNNRYFEGKLTVKSIVYVRGLINYDRFACYSPDFDEILISDKVVKMPIWVLDYMIMHEMTHIYEIKVLHKIFIFKDPSSYEEMLHSKEFWAKVEEYEHMEWAKGYLQAYCLKFRLIDFLGEYFQWRIRTFWTFLELKMVGHTCYKKYE